MNNRVRNVAVAVGLAVGVWAACFRALPEPRAQVSNPFVIDSVVVQALEADPKWAAVSNEVTLGAAAGATAQQPPTLTLPSAVDLTGKEGHLVTFTADGLNFVEVGEDLARATVPLLLVKAGTTTNAVVEAVGAGRVYEVVAGAGAPSDDYMLTGFGTAGIDGRWSQQSIYIPIDPGSPTRQYVPIAELEYEPASYALLLSGLWDPFGDYWSIYDGTLTTEFYKSSELYRMMPDLATYTTTGGDAPAGTISRARSQYVVQGDAVNVDSDGRVASAYRGDKVMRVSGSPDPRFNGDYILNRSSGSYELAGVAYLNWEEVSSNNYCWALYSQADAEYLITAVSYTQYASPEFVPEWTYLWGAIGDFAITAYYPPTASLGVALDTASETNTVIRVLTNSPNN